MAKKRMEPKIEQFKLSQIKPASYNPRTIDDEAMAGLSASMERFGCVEPIVVNIRGGKNTIVGGHQRYKALLKIHGKGHLCECVTVDLNKSDEKLLNLTLNNPRIQGEFIAELAGYIDRLKKGLKNKKDYFDLRINLLRSELRDTGKQGRIDDDQVPDVPKKIITKADDLWILGKHRLLCGDCTIEANVEHLMAGKKADMCVTSPPYGVGKEYEKKGIESWKNTVRPAIDIISKYSKIVCWNIGDLLTTKSQFIEPTFVYSMNFFIEAGMKPIWKRIWLKQGKNYGVGPYHLVTNKPVQQEESIVAVAKEGLIIEPVEREFETISAFAEHNHRYVNRLNRQDKKEWGYSAVWEMNTVKKNDIHAAMFPVELPLRCIKMHSDKNNIIIDLFLGSGTTLIACEKLGRICYGMEIEPKYCDVIVNRWEQWTGRKGRLIRGGKGHRLKMGVSRVKKQKKTAHKGSRGQ